MRFHTIAVEGPDCAGKTTFIEAFHKKTNYSHHIIDRHFLSPYVYANFYKRGTKEKWFDLFLDSLKSFNTLYVVLLPELKVIIERFEERGDEKHTLDTLIQSYSIWSNLCNFVLRDIPNVLILKETDLSKNVDKTINKILELELISGDKLVKSLLFNSGRNELVDLNIKTKVNKNNIDFTVLSFPQEKEYYEDILNKITKKIDRELIGLNENSIPQKLDSRRFVYTDDRCISFIHFLFRYNKLNVKAVLRSSNVSSTFWADYEFLKILSYKTAEVLGIEESEIDLDIEIRSAHIVP